MKFKNIVGISFLILLAAGAQPAIGALWQWSKTANNNATADPSINWSEGMSPSSVNDSARAMMARMAEYRDDISGSLTTAGGPIAFTLTTNQGVSTPTPADGQFLAVTFNQSNGAFATLAVDGGSPLSLLYSTVSGTNLPQNILLTGGTYTMRFSAAAGGWIVQNVYSYSQLVPLGALIPYTGTTVPSISFVFPVGQCLSTTTYAGYWSLLGSPGPGTCPAGQFRILDLSGYTVAALDTMPGGAAAGRLTSSATGCGTAMTSVGAVCANGTQAKQIAVGNLPAITSSNASQSITVNVPGSGSAPYLTTATWTGFTCTSGGALCPAYTAGALNQTSSYSGNNNISVTASGTSGTTFGGAFPTVPPIMGVNYLLRVF